MEQAKKRCLRCYNFKQPEKMYSDTKCNDCQQVTESEIRLKEIIKEGYIQVPLAVMGFTKKQFVTSMSNLKLSFIEETIQKKTEVFILGEALYQLIGIGIQHSQKSQSDEVDELNSKNEIIKDLKEKISNLNKQHKDEVRNLKTSHKEEMACLKEKNKEAIRTLKQQGVSKKKKTEDLLDPPVQSYEDEHEDGNQLNFQEVEYPALENKLNITDPMASL